MARFSDPSRLSQAPRFESLPPANTRYSMHGALTHCVLSARNGEVKLRPIRCFDSLELIEHASVSAGRLIICCDGFLCVLPSLSHPISGTELDPGSDFRIDDPWFAGLHSAIPIDDDICLVSASGPDAVIWVDLPKKLVRRRLRLPASIYGKNYELTEKMSVHDHYIPNDFQLGHLNSAYPDGARACYVTTLGQGDVGHFDESGEYKIVASGYVGAHGIRRSLDGSYLYFSESCAGTLNKINEDCTVEIVFDLKTNWLHDSQQLTEDLFIFLLADSNELVLADIKRKIEITRFSLLSRGENPQFVSVIP